MGEYRVFLSHSGSDKQFVRELYRRLTRDGVSCFFDIESIGWGDNWVKALERALDECEQVVFVLSPDFCNSQWAEVERTSNIADDPSGLKRKVRPLLLHPCSHLPTFPRFLRQVQAIDVSTPALFEQNYPRSCRELGGVLRDDGILADRTRLPPVHPLPERHRMPHGSLGDRFVGRVDAIWSLYDALFGGSTVVLQGLGVVAGIGGLGKTQLAIEYAHRFGSAYGGGVYWVNADRGLATLVTQIGDAAGLEIDTRVEDSEQAGQVWRGLNRLHAPALVVLDNFPEDVDLQPYLPTTGRVHTIVTTRRRDLGRATVGLKTLSAEEGARLLNSGERKFGSSAEVLVERLGGLPLALELAKSYLNFRTDLSIESLMELMKSDGEINALSAFTSNYRDQLPSGHERDVVRTFQMSWEIASDAAKRVLRVMGELAPAPVPRRLLRLVLQVAERVAFEDEVSDGVSELARLSLVELDIAGNPVAHRLIVAFVRHRNRVDQASPLDRCVETIQQQMRRTFDNPDARTNRELEALVAHAEFLLETGPAIPNESRLLNGVGWHYSTMGRLTAARDALSKALASDEKSLKPGHPSIARSQSNLATVLIQLGQLEEARDLLRKALASAEESFEAGHPSIAIRRSNLALVLQDLGQLEEARDLLRLALASNEKSFESGHPSIAISQSNLALVLKDLGQLEEARDLLSKALASAEKSFKAGHPSIARVQSNLALVLKDLGQLEEAHDLLRKALASAEESFEAGHPSIAIRQSNLALVLQDLGQLEEAGDLLRKSLASDEVSFEAGHPSIAISQSNLALVLQDLGQLEEARDLLRKALASDEKSFEPSHPSIACSQSNLAMVLKELGQLEEASDLLRKALTSGEKSFEAGHPSIARRQSNLALVLKDLGQLEEARDLLGKAYSASLERYGPDHPPVKIFKRHLDALGPK